MDSDGENVDPAKKPGNSSIFKLDHDDTSTMHRYVPPDGQGHSVVTTVPFVLEDVGQMPQPDESVKENPASTGVEDITSTPKRLAQTSIASEKSITPKNVQRSLSAKVQLTPKEHVRNAKTGEIRKSPLSAKALEMSVKSFFESWITEKSAADVTEIPSTPKRRAETSISPELAATPKKIPRTLLPQTKFNATELANGSSSTETSEDVPISSGLSGSDASTEVHTSRLQHLDIDEEKLAKKVDEISVSSKAEALEPPRESEEPGVLGAAQTPYKLKPITEYVSPEILGEPKKMTKYDVVLDNEITAKLMESMAELLQTYKKVHGNASSNTPWSVAGPSRASTSLPVGEPSWDLSKSLSVAGPSLACTSMPVAGPSWASTSLSVGEPPWDLSLSVAGPSSACTSMSVAGPSRAPPSWSFAGSSQGASTFNPPKSLAAALNECEEFKPQTNLAPTNCPERILFCIDWIQDPVCHTYDSKLMTLKSLVAAVKKFIRIKSSFDCRHEFGFMTLLDTYKVVNNYTTNIGEICRAVHYWGERIDAEKCDLDGFFEHVLAEALLPDQLPATKDISPPFIVRMILIYRRSDMIPTFGGNTDKCIELLRRSPYFFLDVLYIHEEKDLFEDILSMWYDFCDERSYLFDVKKDDPYEVDVCMMKLLGHALQRPRPSLVGLDTLTP